MAPLHRGSPDLRLGLDRDATRPELKRRLLTYSSDESWAAGHGQRCIRIAGDHRAVRCCAVTGRFGLHLRYLPVVGQSASSRGRPTSLFPTCRSPCTAVETTLDGGPVLASSVRSAQLLPKIGANPSSLGIWHHCSTCRMPAKGKAGPGLLLLPPG